MLLDLSRLRSGVEHVDRTYDPKAFTYDANDPTEFRVAAPVSIVADVTKDVHKARLVGRVKTTLELACSRCLELFALPVDAAVDVLLLPAEANTGEGEKEVADEDLGVSFYENETIDLGAVMREQFYLALPMKALCRDDCKGLCPICGKNRNREACTCESEWVDPRLAVLKKFLEK